MEEHAATVDDMAAQLAAVLQVQGNKGRSEWSKLHGKLAQVAAGAGGDDPTTAVQALCSEPVHMIDEDSNFCKESVDRIVKCSAELSAPDAPYAVVSIVGAQSSGKSFLLNHLFGTRFPVMNALHGRCQTTKGIMMSRCIGPPLILLDVEGFDGREKGQDKLFEKQAALFALTVSDLMMVNILVTDIGREDGGGTSLFRTIFEERVKFQQGITKLIVVLRRYDLETPLSVMKNDVKKSFEKIWGSLNMESEKFMDYIEVHIIGLQDKSSPDFPQEVAALRNLLSNNISAKVPASGFSLSSSMLWDIIKENKNLDIPSHQVAIARLYCQQLVEDTLNSLNSKEEYKFLKTEESPRRFNEISHELLGKLKNKYDLETKKYDTHVRDDERRHLVEKLHRKIKGIAIELAKKLLEDTLKQFIREFSVKNIKDMKEARDGLYKYAEQFVSSCEDLKVYDSDELSKIRRDLEERLASFADKLIEKESARKAKQKKKVVGYVLKGITTAGSIALCAMAADVAGVIDGVSSLVDAAHDGQDSDISSIILDIAHDARPRILDSDIGGAMDHVSNLVAAVQDGRDSDISSIIREIGRDILPHNVFDADLAGAWHSLESSLDSAGRDGLAHISSII